MDFENPFSDYGGIVRGERFIGRHDSLKVVENRIIRPKEPGNLAIIGDYRIGKSSLVYQAVMERKKGTYCSQHISDLDQSWYFRSSAFLFSLISNQQS